ncbi:MAG: hypothetical protein K8R99_06100 [Actinomycetia bacterium]|nr:hypothetical protein [Actinomycetes bacterium]
MTWTHDRVATALRGFDAPAADDAFWERVRSGLLVRESDPEKIALVMSPPDQPMEHVHALVPSPWRARWYVAACAAAALLIAGLYAVGHNPRQTPAASPTSIDPVLTDPPFWISLDDQPRTAAPVVSDVDYVVPDLTQLPQGWTASLFTAFGLFAPSGYYFTYSVVSPTGTYQVNVSSGLSPKPENGDPVDIKGHAGLQTTRQVWWEQEPGVDVTVSQPRGSVVPESGADDLTDVARSLTFVSTKELPIRTIDPDAVPSSKVAQFIGTLSGIQYAVQANTRALRGIFVYAGDELIGGVEEDRLSQPTDAPQTAGDVNIAGVAGYGVIVFGYTDPATAGLRANLADGSKVQVPVLRNPGETYFALPIPLGVEVTSLDFLDDSGDTLRTAIVPTFPAYFGHCCASAQWATQ